MTKEIPMCSDLCEHCNYAMCGDFLCEIDDACTIEDWIPFPCRHPERRKLEDADESADDNRDDN